MPTMPLLPEMRCQASRRLHCQSPPPWLRRPSRCHHQCRQPQKKQLPRRPTANQTSCPRWTQPQAALTTTTSRREKQLGRLTKAMIIPQRQQPLHLVVWPAPRLLKFYEALAKAKAMAIATTTQRMALGKAFVLKGLPAWTLEK